MARVDAVGPQLTILHNFGNGALRPDPAYPSGGLIQAADGTFFGVATVQRGSQDSERAGAVFQFWSTGEFEVIQDFPHPLLLGPVCPLLLYKGDLIGMCSGAPKWDNPGAVFRLKFSNATGRWQITLWHDFVSDQLGEGAVPNPYHLQLGKATYQGFRGRGRRRVRERLNFTGSASMKSPKRERIPYF